jgi:hypothetical protein
MAVDGSMKPFLVHFRYMLLSFDRKEARGVGSNMLWRVERMQREGEGTISA